MSSFLFSDPSLISENRDVKDLLADEMRFALTIFLGKILSERPVFLLVSYTYRPAFPYPYFVITFVLGVVMLVRPTVLVSSSAADSTVLGLEFIPVFLRLTDSLDLYSVGILL
jgi:hypothetical protein